MSDSFGARSSLEVGGREYEIYRLDALQEKFDVAREHYRRLTALEGDSFEGWYNLGLLSQKQGDFDESRRAYKRAVEIKADSIEAHLNLKETTWLPPDRQYLFEGYLSADTRDTVGVNIAGLGASKRDIRSVRALAKRTPSGGGTSEPPAGAGSSRNEV